MITDICIYSVNNISLLMICTYQSYDNISGRLRSSWLTNNTTICRIFPNLVPPRSFWTVTEWQSLVLHIFKNELSQNWERHENGNENYKCRGDPGGYQMTEQSNVSFMYIFFAISNNHKIHYCCCFEYSVFQWDLFIFKIIYVYGVLLCIVRI